MPVGRGFSATKADEPEPAREAGRNKIEPRRHRDDRLKLFLGKDQQSHMLHSGSSYLSQSELVLTFGLGSRTKADAIEVYLASGAVESWQTSMPDKQLPFRKGRASSVRGPTAPARFRTQAQSKRSNGAFHARILCFIGKIPTYVECFARGVPSARFRRLGTTSMRRTPLPSRCSIAALDPRRGPSDAAKPACRNAARLNNLGVAYMNQQLFEKGLHAFEQSAAADPKFQTAGINRGIALVNLQRVDEAKQILEDAAKRDPKDPHVWYNLGLLYKNSEGPQPRSTRSATSPRSIPTMPTPGTSSAPPTRS